MANNLPNTQWQYLILDAEDGGAWGTNDERVAKEFARSETCFVIAVASCQVIVCDGSDQVFTADNIPEQQLFKF